MSDKSEVAVAVGLAIYARMTRLAMDRSQVVGEKNDYYVTLAQLEKAFVELRDEVGAEADSGAGLKVRLAARIDEYAFIRQMVAGVEKEGWYQRRIAHLQGMYDQAGPQSATETK